ncbi:MAG: DUF2283 domain-containing protein [Planctomycetes bacterium]|nr:DUF2283 domain-containing protein [Planctomycetota bacterium]MCB9935530.1 DUF2283 domain-containing protein [Planctomycetota bacterium]
MPDFPYLQVTFRDGKFFAAYLYLAEPKGEHRPKTKRLSGSVLLDIDEQGNAVGVEILSRDGLDADTLNALLKPYGVRTIQPRELSTAA